MNTIETGAAIMTFAKGSFTRFFLVLSGCALLAGGLLWPPEAGAWTYSRSAYRGWNSNSVRSMQRQAHSAAAEARREPARQANRERIQRQRTEFQSDFVASQRAIRASARAASRAPRGPFFRRPGFTTSSLRPGAVEMEVGGTTFFYDRGMFFRQLPNKYMVVPAPVGAVVDTLPDGTGAALYNNDLDTYFFHFGTFFAREGDKYKVVSPPPGVIVDYVPDGYIEIEVGEGVQYQFGDIIFEPVFLNDDVRYAVA